MQQKALFLTAPQVREAILELEGVRLPQRTLVSWLQSGLATASVRWDRFTADGRPARGPAHATLFNLSDLARIRLVVRLRKITQLSAFKVRLILDYIEADLREALRPKSRAKIYVAGSRVLVVMPGSDVPVDASARGQGVLFLASELLERNEEVAERVGAVRGAA